MAAAASRNQWTLVDAPVVASILPNVFNRRVGTAPGLMPGWVDKCALVEAVRGTVRVFFVITDDVVRDAVLLAVRFLFFTVNLIHDKDFVVVLGRLVKLVEGGHQLHVGKVWQIPRTIGLYQDLVAGFR